MSGASGGESATRQLEALRQVQEATLYISPQTANEICLEQQAEDRAHYRRTRHLGEREEQDRQNQYERWLDR